MHNRTALTIFTIVLLTGAVITAHPTNDLNFYAFPRKGTLPLTVTFQNISQGPYTGWHWDFGDGDTSDQQSPVHTYTRSGAYTVTLTGRNQDTTKTYQVKDFIEARYIDPCAFGSTIPAEKLELTNYVVDTVNSGIALAPGLDPAAAGTASFVFDAWDILWWMVLTIIPDKAGPSAYKVMVDTACVLDTIIPADSTDVIDITTRDGVRAGFGDTIIIEGRSPGPGRARIQSISFYITADCFINGIDIVYPATVSLAAGSLYTYTPWIFGCYVCYLSYYLLEGPDAMGINMANGTITWQPTESDTGTHVVKISPYWPPNTALPETITFQVNKKTGIADHPTPDQQLQWRMPNPIISGNRISLTVRKPGLYTLESADLCHTVHRQEKRFLQAGENKIPVPGDLPPGMVFLKLSQGNNAYY